MRRLCPLPAVCAVAAAAVAAALPPPPQQAVASHRAAAAPAVAKDCWFLHGSGMMPDQAGPPTADFVDYWGRVHEYAQGCQTLHFNHVDTVTQAIDAPALRQATCAALCSSPYRPGCEIEDKIIFTHSAGNLYFASALREGDCKIGAGTDWFTASAPARGSALWCDHGRPLSFDGLDVLCPSKVPCGGA
jgi:hypothetical protein